MGYFRFLLLSCKTFAGFRPAKLIDTATLVFYLEDSQEGDGRKREISIVAFTAGGCMKNTQTECEEADLLKYLWTHLCGKYLKIIKVGHSVASNNGEKQ